MRWIWIDRILELERGKRIRAVKNVSLGEDVLHDHFAAGIDAKTGETLDPLPVMPASLLIEGMAQTAGILVGHANDFREKVILAKISKAKIEREVSPGQTVFFDAQIENMDANGASTIGTISVLDHTRGGHVETIGSIEQIFSHIDQNRAGTEFPDHNFVFTENFRTLLTISGVL